MEAHWGDCERCGEHRPLTHKVISELYTIAVCTECAVTARRLESTQDDTGKIHVERL